MFEYEGKTYKKLALHGGGCPMLGHYIGLFKSLNWFETWESFTIPLVTTSAGSIAILFSILNILDKRADVSFIFNAVFEESQNLLQNLDSKSIISYEFFDNLIKTNFACIYDVTFQDLKNLSPNMDWTVCCTKYTNFEFSSERYGTHTPDVVVWKACVASMALPVIFSPIEINGSLFVDGYFSDWIKDTDDVDTLHIMGEEIDLIQLSTGITLFDELLNVFKKAFLALVNKTEPINVCKVYLTASVFTDFLSEEYIQSGKSMSEKFVLKSKNPLVVST